MISEAKLHQMEQDACTWDPDSILAMYVRDLVTEVRSLRHELADPNYQYVGRIHRQAILCRNAEIDSLREQVAALKQIEAVKVRVEAPK